MRFRVTIALTLFLLGGGTFSLFTFPRWRHPRQQPAEHLNWQQALTAWSP
jgi:hypothetical protein